MTAEWFSPPSKALDSNANPFSGATWSFYVSGTLTPQNVFADAALSTSLGSTVTADSSGKFPNIYFDASLSYRGICKSSDGATTLHDVDPINTDVIRALATDEGAGLLGLSVDSDYVAGTVGDRLKRVVYVTDAPFLAAGNGSTDDTAAIQAAIDYAETIASGSLCTGATVYFPPGTYKVSATLTVTVSGVCLEGSGVQAAALLRTTDYGDTLRISSNGTASPTSGIVGIRVRGIQFIHATNVVPVQTSGAAVAMYGAQESLIEDCLAINHYDHFSMYGGSSNIWNRLYVISFNGDYTANNGAGIGHSCYRVGYLAGSGVVNAPAKIVMTDCGANGGFYGAGYPGTSVQNFAALNLSATYGYYITGGEQVELRQCQASNAKVHNLHIELLAGAASNIFEVSVIGGYFDAAGFASAWIGGPNGPAAYCIINTKIVGTTFKGNAIGASLDGIVLDGTTRTGAYPQAVVNLTVSGCTIGTYNRNGVLANGGKNLIFSGNQIVGNNITDGSTCNFTGSISSNILTVTAVSSGYLAEGMTLNSAGTPVLGSQILPLSGSETIGGVGRYAITAANLASTAIIATQTRNGSGFVLGATVDTAVVSGSRIGGKWDATGTAPTLYGVEIRSGATGIIIDGCDLTGNTIGPILDSTPAVTTAARPNWVTNCKGYNGNRTPQSPAMPASTTAQYNLYGVPCMVQVYGGTVTAIQVNGAAINGVISGVFYLGPGDRVSITYTVAPSWIWWPQ